MDMPEERCITTPVPGKGDVLAIPIALFFPNLLPQMCPLYSEQKNRDFIPSVQHLLLDSFVKENKKKPSKPLWKRKHSREEKQFWSPSKALSTVYIITDTDML